MRFYDQQLKCVLFFESTTRMRVGVAFFRIKPFFDR